MKDTQEPLTQETLVDQAEIDRRMTIEGFAELQRVWERFRESGKKLVAINAEALTNQEDRHMRPLLGWPRSLSSAAVFGSIAVTYWAAPISVWYHGWPNPFWIAYVIGLAFLVLMSVTFLQRYCLYPFDRLLADRVAWLLAHRDYRNGFDSSPRTQRLLASLRAGGVHHWDSSTYRALYDARDGAVCEESESSINTFVLQGIRDFVGRKNETTRKFEPGQFFHNLVGGKAAVSGFVRQHRATIDALKNDDATRDQMADAIDDLLRLVAEGSKGSVRLQELRRSIGADHFVPTNRIQAEVWQRDPWIDLTHQNEFYSSSGLRGVQMVGRGPKGRLAPVLYLDDPSLCCLDLRDSHKRLVRCRLIASQVGQSCVIFVDGVEGTNQVAPAVVHRAIVDYANHCGFQNVLFNATVHNRTPKRFARHLSIDHELQAVRVRSLDTERRQYLDAFSFPLEPMEYARADGVALIYAAEKVASERLLSWKMFHWFRMQVLNLIAALAVAGAAISAFSFQPKLVILLAVIVAPMLVIHYRSQAAST